MAQPKTGKTMLLKAVANAIAENHPECYLMVVLVMNDRKKLPIWKEASEPEVMASTFDEPAEKHVKVSTIALQKQSDWLNVVTMLLYCSIRLPVWPVHTIQLHL